MHKRKTLRFFVAFIICCCFQYSVSAQTTDFKNYKPLRVQGSIPKIFRQDTEDKISAAAEEDRSEMSESEERIFLEGIHYRLDDLLNSGIVLYGDETTKYVEKVGQKLLEKDPKLKKKIRFLVLKSNVTNALATDQGIIFVTLGLLSQLENEAQLAYILSHEIVHYTEDHIEKAYTERNRTLSSTRNYDERLRSMSHHSRTAEFEADKAGVKRYHQAGYAKDEVMSTFDVLTYSYLPFDEVRMPLDYFNSELLYVPERYFPDEINPILADEDYDDSKSSHPNIRKRRNEISSAVNKYTSWQDNEFLVSKEEFLNVRNIARFESVRLDLLNHQFGSALYSIFLLEKDYPNNEYLQRCKAKSWLGLVSFKVGGKFSRTVSRPSKVEGESHAMHYLLRKLSKLQLMTVAMRNIKDIHDAYPENAEIKLVYERMVRHLAGYRSFDLEDYSEITFEQAAESFEKSKQMLESPSDSTETTEVKEDDGKELSKYDKIKNKSKGTTATSVIEDFDSTKFHLFALSDLVGDEEFKALYLTKKDDIAEQKKEEERLSNLSKREWRTEMSKKHDAIKEVVLIEPVFGQFRGNEIEMKESESREDEIVAMTKRLADKFGIQVYDLTNSKRSALTSDGYNERAVLQDYVRQRGDYGDVAMFPVDFMEIKELRDHYGDVNVLFIYGSYTRNYGVGSRRTQINMALINLKTAKVERADENYFRGKPGKVVMEGHLYDMMSILNSSK